MMSVSSSLLWQHEQLRPPESSSHIDLRQREVATYSQLLALVVNKVHWQMSPVKRHMEAAHIWRFEPSFLPRRRPSS